MIITVYAKERGSAPADNPHHPSTIIAHYDAPIPPPIPLQTGQKIRILELVPSPPPPLPGGENAPPHYTVRDTGIVGTVEAVRSMEEAIIEFAVKNENDLSPATYAYISTPYIPGKTVRLQPWEMLRRALLLPPLLRTRHIPLETNAVVLRNVTRLRPERERRTRSGRGESRLEEDMIVESEDCANDR
ncbi:hypothetical protein OH77DRAFT_707267 [Trametes cingulata]|nr:hypothetical protein OH77DRAFT_707267 [Trametes cingulata]